jgi:cyclic pyranopterin phosphate synthase
LEELRPPDAGGAAHPLSHLDESGRPRMVDVGDKEETKRTAAARGSVYMRRETLALIRAGGVFKGDVLSVAQTAGIMAAKRTADAIPMCHNIFLSGVEMRFAFDEERSAIHIEAAVRTTGKTGVEMEALHAVSVAALTIYDMCKAADRSMRITDIRLHRKEGGKSGLYEEG